MRFSAAASASASTSPANAKTMFLPDEVAAEVRADLLGARRFQRRRESVGGVAVGMIGVEVARRRSGPPARGRRCGARRSGPITSRRVRSSSAAREGRPHQHVGQQRQIGVQVARQHLAFEARRVGRRRDVQRGAQRVQRRVELLARLAAGATPGPLGGQVRQPLAVARIGRRARARRDDHVHQRDGAVALDDQHRARRSGPAPAAPSVAAALAIAARRRPPPASPTAARRSSSDTRSLCAGAPTTTERAPVAR